MDLHWTVAHIAEDSTTECCGEWQPILLATYALCVTLCHFVPLCSTLFHFLPLCSTLIHFLPLCLFHFVPLYATLFYFVPLCGTVWHFVPLCATLCSSETTEASDSGNVARCCFSNGGCAAAPRGAVSVWHNAVGNYATPSSPKARQVLLALECWHCRLGIPSFGRVGEPETPPNRRPRRPRRPRGRQHRHTIENKCPKLMQP